MAVGEQDQRRAPVGPCDPLGLLESAEIAAGEIGHATGPDLRESRAGGSRVAERAGGDRHADLIVEDDEAEAILGSQAREQPIDRDECGVEPVVGHRAGAVEDDLQGRGRALDGVLKGGSGELEEDVNGVFALDRDEIEVQLRVDLHGGTVGAGTWFLTSAAMSGAWPRGRQ